MIFTDYHHISMNSELRRNSVQKIIEVLDKNFGKDVGIALTGLSGIMIGTLVADATNRPFFVVRKDKEISHGRNIEGYFCEKYVIIDDMILTGATIDRILAEVSKRTLESDERNVVKNLTSECVGIILYKLTLSEYYGGIKIYTAV